MAYPHEESLKRAKICSNANLVEEIRVYEMSWQDFVNADLNDSEWEAILKLKLPAAPLWEMVTLEPWHPFPPSEDPKWREGYVRFHFVRKYE